MRSQSHPGYVLRLAAVACRRAGRRVWETNMVFGQPDTRITAAPLAINDKIIVGAAGGDSGVRDFIAAFDALLPAPDARLRLAGAPHDGIGAQPIRGAQHDL